MTAHLFKKVTQLLSFMHCGRLPEGLESRTSDRTASSEAFSKGTRVLRFNTRKLATGSLGQGLSIGVGEALKRKTYRQAALQDVRAPRRQRDGRRLSVGGDGDCSLL